MLDPINDKLKKSIEQHNISWDKEAMWLDIEPQLPKKRDRKWLLLLLMFIVFSFVVGFYVLNNSKTVANEPMAATDTERINSIEKTVTNVEKTISSSAVTTNKIASTKNNSNITSDYTTTVNSANHSKKTIVANHKIFDISKETSLNNVPAIANNKKNSNLDSALVPINDNSKLESQLITSKNSTLNSRTVASVQGLANNINLLIDNNLLNLDLKPEVTNLIVPKRSLPSSLSLMTGAFAFDKRYTVNSELGNDLNEAYTPLYAINFSLVYNKPINDRWTISSGMEVQYDVEKFDYTSINTTTQTISVDTAYFFIEDEAKVFIAGNREKVTTKSRNVISYNTKLSLGIPLYLSYQLRSNRSSLSIMGGPIAHITALEQGNSIQTQSNIVDLNTKAFDLSSLSYSFDLSLMYSYRLKNNLKLAVSPTLRKQINASSDASNINFKRNFIGLRAGIHWTI